MNLEEGCALAQEITRVPITRLETAPQRADFCSAHQFHPAQDLQNQLDIHSKNTTICFKYAATQRG